MGLCLDNANGGSANEISSEKVKHSCQAPYMTRKQLALVPSLLQGRTSVDRVS